MSVSKGTGIGDVELRGMAIGDKEIAGLAVGSQIVFEVGADIYDMPTAPTSGERNTPVTFVAHCNKFAESVVTYTVGSGGALTGIVRTVNSITDLDDGTRLIEFTVSFGTRGTRTMRTFGTTNPSSGANYRSLSYIDSTISIS